MLNSDTKKKIDDLCNILVAKFPIPQDQVDQITVALTYKFMSDMDSESISMGGERSFFKGDWEDYTWEKLFEPKTSGNKRNEIYKFVIENMETNPNLPPLFREIFSNPPNPFNDVKKLYEFLKTINFFSYQNSETLGNAYEYLLSKTGAQGQLGQFRTPRHIIDFIVEIVNPKSNEKILDPACGTAGFLVSAFKHIKINEKNLTSENLMKLSQNLEGYDIEPKMIRISLLNMFLQGFSTPKIKEIDLLSDDTNWNEYFDVILANPPFFTPKGGISPHRGFSLDSKRAEIHFIDYIQTHLRPNGRAGIIVPETILDKKDKAYTELRNKIIENSLIGVVSLPPEVFLPYASKKTSILFFDKEIAKNIKSIFFGKITNDGFSLNNDRREIAENDIPEIKDSILKGNKTNKKFIYIDKSRIISNEKRFLSSRIYEETEDFKSPYPVHKITDVFEVISPPKKIKKREFLEKGKFPIIDQSKDKIAGYWNEEKDRVIVKKPLVIFGDHTRVVKYIDFDFVAGADGIKVLNPCENILPKYLFYILNFINLEDLGYSRHFKILKEKSILLPPIDVQKKIIDELEEHEKTIDKNKKIIETNLMQIKNKLKIFLGSDQD